MPNIELPPFSQWIREAEPGSKAVIRVDKWTGGVRLVERTPRRVPDEFFVKLGVTARRERGMPKKFTFVTDRLGEDDGLEVLAVGEPGERLRLPPR